jgi:CRP-like cAMP-binding protein
MINKERMTSVEIFKGLRQDELEEIAELCEEVIFADGDRVLTEGERADYLYILEGGRVDLRFELPNCKTSEDMTVSTTEPGECFAWSAMVPQHIATLSCYSTGMSGAIRIEGVKLLNLCKRNSHMGFIIMQNIAVVMRDRLTKLEALFVGRKLEARRFLKFRQQTRQTERAR